MENPQSWGPVERKIHEAKQAWEKSHAEGVVGYSCPAYIAIQLRKAELLNEVTAEELLETAPEAVAENALRNAIAKLSAQCSSRELELFSNLYPRLRKDNLESAYNLLVRTVKRKRNEASENDRTS